MILGRFPSRTFISRPEAVGLLEKFVPISNAIQKGDMAAFKHALGPESGNQEWFFCRGVFLPLLYRCEVLVWRSLARRVFLLTYQFPTDPNSRKAPTLEVSHVVAAAQYCQKLLEGWVPNPASYSNHLMPPPGGPKRLRAQEGTIYGNKMPNAIEIEAMLSSLLQQGFLHGFISHNQEKFAILGAKLRGGPLNAGFPAVWEVLKARAEREGRGSEVPGWVQTERKGGGNVINLTGIARPVGSG